MARVLRYFPLIGVLVSGLLALTPWASRADAPVPAIAAAANIKFALDHILSNFTAETGLRLRVSYGSSGNFVAQIQHGAPFEMLLSADERYIAELHKLGLTQGEGVQYAIGRLAIVAPKSSPLSLDAQLAGLKALLASGQLGRFVIANPEHAPYGERAREVLMKLGVWDDIRPKLILGENASQAAQFAVSGSTQGGIIPLSLAVTPQFQALGRYVALPEDLHGALGQRMALMPKASSTTERFYQYLQSDAARTVLSQYGFGLPQQ
ncbi:MAG: molybdate ABC transporter substrate-binding protein [Shewanella sp.]|uniref:molybdate ABC transporter substrate-binding protein n=1 Tax=Shewanella sp. TaxID=50422 RepID=UPI003F32BC03